MHILPKLSSTVISLLSASFSGFTIVALGLFYSDVGTASDNKAILLPIESYVAMGLGALLHVIVTLLNLVITTKLVDKDMGRCLKNHSQFKIPIVSYLASSLH